LRPVDRGVEKAPEFRLYKNKGADKKKSVGTKLGQNSRKKFLKGWDVKNVRF